MENKKVVKFKAVQIGQDFILPNFQRKFDNPYTKISKVSYADTITRLVYWDDGELNIEIKEEKSNEKKIQKKKL